MNINFDFSCTTQSKIFFEDLKIAASEKLIDFSKQYENIAPFTGLPIAICFSLLNLAADISTIAESLIKGIANILGSPFEKNCNFLKGVKQLFLQIPLKILNVPIDWPVRTAYDILSTPYQMYTSPINTLNLIKGKAENNKNRLKNLELVKFLNNFNYSIARFLESNKKELFINSIKIGTIFILFHMYK